MIAQKFKSTERGQATIEAILILTILLAVSTAISDSFTKNNFFASLIEGPWDYVDGMIRDGVWKKSSVSHVLNPNARTRHASVQAVLHDAGPDKVFNLDQSNLKGP